MAHLTFATVVTIRLDGFDHFTPAKRALMCVIITIIIIIIIMVTDMMMITIMTMITNDHKDTHQHDHHHVQGLPTRRLCARLNKSSPFSHAPGCF